MSTPRSLAVEPLRQALRQWCEALETLRLTVAEDRPAPGDSALADRLADDTDEVIGWLSEAIAGLERPDEFDDAPRLVGRALRTQGEALFGCVRQAHLEQLARGPDGRWRAWVSAVRSSLEPLWARSEEVVTRLALPPPPSSPSVPPLSGGARPNPRSSLFQDNTTLNQSN